MRIRALFFSGAFSSVVCSVALAQIATKDAAVVFPYHDSVGLVVRHANEMDYPFRSGTRPGQKYSRGFESVLDCLPPADAEKSNPDLTSFELDGSHSRYAVETCVFRIAASYEAPDDMAAWLSQNSPDVTTGFDECCGNKMFVSGKWDLKVTGHPWRANWFERFLDEQAVVHISYSPNGDVLEVFAFTLD